MDILNALSEVIEMQWPTEAKIEKSNSKKIKKLKKLIMKKLQLELSLFYSLLVISSFSDSY